MSPNNSITPGKTGTPNDFALTILLWTWPSGYTFPLNKCPAPVDASGCFFTVDKNMYVNANAVVIHHRDINFTDQLPQMSRPSNQYWIWFNMEPPEHVKDLNMMDNIINLTMSYRADSDIFSPYGWLEKNDKRENFTVPRKSKLVAWVISNWNTKQKRIEYYSELKNHLQIDLYGKHHLPLPKRKQYLLLSQYKFYLAFENYIHEDYITEKLWYNSFYAGAVPVVMGPSRRNYERFIPSSSFIHVDDFSSPKDLADYLLKLDKDDEAYQQYFTWRTYYKPAKTRDFWIYEYCRVCKALKEAPPYRTIPSIANWFT
ncbi:4-galactosyl-N-acetylglucosaminide 3-alpha-L-fucosyltransferase FUT6-like [Gastrophryne carolinensis]